MPERVRVGIIDDHPVLREGLRGVIDDTGEFLVVTSGENLHDAIAMAQNDALDILLLDINIPGNGLDVARMLARSYPRIRIVMFTVSDRTDHLQLALAHGAIGYLLKGATGDEIIRCLRSVKVGRRYVSPELAGRALGADRDEEIAQPRKTRSGAHLFTVRETAVASLLGSGKTNKEIAVALDITEKTVKHHMSVIMEKLNVRNRVEAALLLSRRDGADLQ